MRVFGILGVVIVLCAGFFIYQRSVADLPEGSPQQQIDTTAIRQRLLTIGQTERQYQATNGKYATLEAARQRQTCCRAAPSNAATPSPRGHRDGSRSPRRRPPRTKRAGRRSKSPRRCRSPRNDARLRDRRGGALHRRRTFALCASADKRNRRCPATILPQPYQTTRDWGELPRGREVGGGHGDRAGARRHHLRDPSLLRELVREPARGADPQIQRRRQVARAVGREDVHLPARRHRRSRRQSLGHRRARRERHRPPGLQIQSRRQGPDDARQGGRQRIDARSLRSADRRRRSRRAATSS